MAASVLKSLVLLPFLPIVLTKRMCCTTRLPSTSLRGGADDEEATSDGAFLGTPRRQSSSETKAPLKTPSSARDDNKATGSGYNPRTRRTRTGSAGSQRSRNTSERSDGYPFDDDDDFAASFSSADSDVPGTAGSPRSPSLKDYAPMSTEKRSRAASIEHNSRFIHGGGGDKDVMTQVIMAEKMIGWLRKIYWVGCILFVALACEYCREAYSRGRLTYQDLLQDMPSQAITSYLALSLALFAFRNDFPFNLVILIVCAFFAGRYSSSVEIEALVEDAVDAARRAMMESHVGKNSPSVGAGEDL